MNGLIGNRNDDSGEDSATMRTMSTSFIPKRMGFLQS